MLAPTEIEELLAQARGFAWTKADSDKVAEQVKLYNLLRFEAIGKRYPYKMAYEFVRSHEGGLDTISEATRWMNLRAREWGVSYEFVACIMALGYMAQDTISQGFAMGMALSMNSVVREPFCIFYALGVETQFWQHKKEGE